MFKSFISKLLGLDRKALKIKSIRRTFNTTIMGELTRRMVVHDDRVYEVSDLEWIHGMVQVLLEEEMAKKVLTGARIVTTGKPVLPDTIVKKPKTFH